MLVGMGRPRGSSGELPRGFLHVACVSFNGHP